MADCTKNAILVAIADRVKLTKILDHKGKKSQTTKILKNSKFYEKCYNGRIDPKCYIGDGKRSSKTEQNVELQGLMSQITKI